MSEHDLLTGVEVDQAIEAGPVQSEVVQERAVLSEMVEILGVVHRGFEVARDQHHAGRIPCLERSSERMASLHVDRGVEHRLGLQVLDRVDGTRYGIPNARDTAARVAEAAHECRLCGSRLPPDRELNVRSIRQ